MVLDADPDDLAPLPLLDDELLLLLLLWWLDEDDVTRPPPELLLDEEEEEDDEKRCWPLAEDLMLPPADDEDVDSLSDSNLRASGLNCSINWQLAGPSTKGRSTR